MYLTVTGCLINHVFISKFSDDNTQILIFIYFSFMNYLKKLNLLNQYKCTYETSSPVLITYKIITNAKLSSTKNAYR